MGDKTETHQEIINVISAAKINVHPKSFKLSGSSKLSMQGKTVPTQQDLKHRHSYVISNLKVIAIISIPIILAIVIAYVFSS